MESRRHIADARTEKLYIEPMSKWFWDEDDEVGDEPVPYEDFKTGFTFGEIRNLMFSTSEDPADWRPKRRGSVLGFWKETKEDMYREYLRKFSEAKKAADSPVPF
jgi:hypothetical protein